MAEISLEQFLHDFRQEVLANAETDADFVVAEFTQTVADELVESGAADGFDACFFKSPSGGMRVDGFWFNDSTLDLFITDFADRESLQSLTQTEVGQIFRRAEGFFTTASTKDFYMNLEETSPGYGLAREIADRRGILSKVNFYLISDRVLSERLKELSDTQEAGYTFSYQIWDISRLYRLRSSQGAREELKIDLVEMTGAGLPCLAAHPDYTLYRSYLIAVPATILADLYEKYGSRLLEQNVRSFLQVRGNVNKGIRTTIINEPEMFFAYNNGITATARQVETVERDGQTLLTSLTDFQIVNGGQTTASLFHTRRKDKVSLDSVFVQMKLSIVDEESSEEVVPKISEYANTQNKVNAADFFSNHPFHIRIENFSRRVWAPAHQGAQRETKWFYERARGQYADSQNKLSPGEQKRFQAEYPKLQMFTKTDLAKFETVWSDDPVPVNLGAQKNFAYYARRIGQEWDKNPDQFNEAYFRRLVARAIIFRRTEKIVSGQPWYSGGYRANIVAYAIAMLARVFTLQKKAYNFQTVWSTQEIPALTVTALEIAGALVHSDIMKPPPSISNISEWCKKEACWTRLQSRSDELLAQLPEKFLEDLVTAEDEEDQQRSAVKSQRMLNGIEAQRAVLNISAETWLEILNEGKKRKLYSAKETGILEVACQMPSKIPSDRQALVLLEILEKARREAIFND